VPEPLNAPTLIAVAHGTRDPNGLAEIQRLINIVRTKRPDIPIELCWLDGASPTLASLLPTVAGPAVVVPILLSTGYHVKVDIPAIVGDRPDTAIASPLGPDKRISRVVFQRLRAARTAETGPDEDIHVVAAGSSDPDARAELDVVAGHLKRWNHHDVSVGQLTDADPFARAHPGSQVANYLLAPGYFNDMLHLMAAGELPADVVADPIGAHPLVADVILDRYAAAASAAGLSAMVL
jgi:sirohydrochlorin ferrochelatase